MTARALTVVKGGKADHRVLTCLYCKEDVKVYEFPIHLHQDAFVCGQCLTVVE